MSLSARSAAAIAVASALVGAAFTAAAEPVPYSIEYRAHVQSIGWQPWVKDGQTAGTTGKALRVEAVQIRLVPKEAAPAPSPTATPTASPTPTPTPTPSGATFAFTADTGMESTGKAVLAKIGASDPDVTAILGDLAYEPNAVQAFCDQVNTRVPGVVEIVAGNHEEMGSTDGYIDDYAACLPNELSITGTYAKDYFFDVGDVRVILISPDIELVGPDSRYLPGTPGKAWLEQSIRDAKAAGKWVVVGMHHPCFSIGMHGCADTTPDVSNIALAEKVDLVVSGHDHNYMRTHQLRGSVGAPAVADSDGSYAKDAGTVFAVVGNGGHNPRTVAAKTSLWAAANGTNSTGGFAFGYGELSATATTLSWRHVSAGGATLTDTFTITR